MGRLCMTFHVKSFILFYVFKFKKGVVAEVFYALFDFLRRKWSFGALSGIMSCAAVCFVVALSEMCHATLGSSCYFILRRKLFVHHARSRCQDYGGHLAIIHNKEENALIQGLAKG